MPKICFLFFLCLLAGNAWAQMPLDSLALSEQTEFTSVNEAMVSPEKVYRLNLSQANLTAFPENLERFVNLQVLYLGSHTTGEGYFEKGTNKIKNIPESIGKLKNLQQLSLSDNMLEGLPEVICGLSNLEYLAVNTNRLRSLPANLDKLTKLKVLTLYENQLSSLPASFGKLISLQELSLRNNALKEFPAFLCNLTNLQEVSLSDNQIGALPAELGNLKNLKTLNISNNALKRLPTSIGDLAQLQALSVSGNQITYLPDALGALQMLTDLDLSENQLKSLPASITSLVGLEELRLSANQLKELPEGLGNLVSLKRLILSQNLFRTLSDSIGKLGALEILQLSQNQLVALPASIGELMTLQSLSVSQNQLVFLPESLGNLPNLKSIFAENNRIQTLPASFGEKHNLREIYISHNPLKYVSLKMLAKMETSDWLMLSNLERDMREQYINRNGSSLFTILEPHYKNNKLLYARLLNFGAWWHKENKQYAKALAMVENAHRVLLQVEKDSAKTSVRKPELQNEITETRYKIETNLKAIKAIKDNLDLQARITNYTQIGATLLILFVLLITFLIYRNGQEQKAKNKIIEAERAKSEKLLLNILPKDVVQELKEKGETQVRRFDNATIMFADVKGFSRYASKVTPEVLVNELNTMFTQMDNYAEEHKIERVKTIGDCYMAVGGCPEANKSHSVDSCLCALKIQHWMQEEEKNRDGNFWQVRMGLHTGELVAGVVGKLKFAFDVWGSAVNVASRMESGGEVGKVNISATTYDYVQDFFDCTYRGEIEAKNIGAIKTYFINRIKPELSADADGLVPNERFHTLYKERFG